MENKWQIRRVCRPTKERKGTAHNSALFISYWTCRRFTLIFCSVSFSFKQHIEVMWHYSNHNSLGQLLTSASNEKYVGNNADRSPPTNRINRCSWTSLRNPFISRMSCGNSEIFAQNRFRCIRKVTIRNSENCPKLWEHLSEIFAAISISITFLLLLLKA